MGRDEKFILGDFRVKLSHMPLDDLHDLQMQIGRECSIANSAKNVLRMKLDAIKAMMAEKRGQGDMGISDHAVLRYLERYKGLDVAAVRAEIRALIPERRLSRRRKAEHHEIGNGLIAVIPGGSIVATIYKDDSAV
jgi:hypothetical protein